MHNAPRTIKYVWKYTPMRTTFLCESPRIRFEGEDKRDYHVYESLTVRYRGRWLPMVIEDIRQAEGDAREIVLRLNQQPQSSYLQRTLAMRLAEVAEESPNAWMDQFFGAIQGANGAVTWGD